LEDGNLVPRPPVLVDDPALRTRRRSSSLPTTAPDASISANSRLKARPPKGYRPAVGEQLAAIRKDVEVAKLDARRRVRLATMRETINHIF
jgi:hypothetical protein